MRVINNIAVEAKSDTVANWNRLNPVLDYNTYGFEIETGNFKVGDGVRAWSELLHHFPVSDSNVFKVRFKHIDQSAIKIEDETYFSNIVNREGVITAAFSITAKVDKTILNPEQSILIELEGAPVMQFNRNILLGQIKLVGFNTHTAAIVLQDQTSQFYIIDSSREATYNGSAKRITYGDIIDKKIIIAGEVTYYTSSDNVEVRKITRGGEEIMNVETAIPTPTPDVKLSSDSYISILDLVNEYGDIQITTSFIKLKASISAKYKSDIVDNEEYIDIYSDLFYHFNDEDLINDVKVFGINGFQEYFSLKVFNDSGDLPHARLYGIPNNEIILAPVEFGDIYNKNFSIYADFVIVR